VSRSSDVDFLRPPTKYDPLHLRRRPRVVHGSILCDPIQPNPSADWPNLTHYKGKNLDPTRHPTQPNTTNNRAYSLAVTYFYTQNLSVFGTCQTGRKIKFKCLVKASRALNALTQSFQIFSIFAVVDPAQPNPWTTWDDRNLGPRPQHALLTGWPQFGGQGKNSGSFQKLSTTVSIHGVTVT